MGSHIHSLEFTFDLYISHGLWLVHSKLKQIQSQTKSRSLSVRFWVPGQVLCSVLDQLLCVDNLDSASNL